MLSFTKVESGSFQNGVLIVATNPNHELPKGMNYKTVSSLADISWDEKSLCATVYVIEPIAVQGLTRLRGVLLPVGGLLALDDELVAYGNGIVTPITVPELSLALADSGVAESEASDEEFDDE